MRIKIILNNCGNISKISVTNHVLKGHLILFWMLTAKNVMTKKRLRIILIVFFTQIASELVNELPKQDSPFYDVDSVKFKEYYEDIVPNSFHLQEVSEDFILEELNCLNPFQS